ncbi:MAG: hypothetical protein PHC31_10425 [Clostridia bacterium]|nr:hypothetical protein [Clostridia bacterium]MDD3093552.1 hypothetical protein [Clostridia bacterium]MDD3972314.1 hypothetical protein [Clostridia bacterium]
MDLKKIKVLFSLQDVDGITISGKEYKALGGASLVLIAKDYPVMNFKSMINGDSRPAVMLNTTDKFTNRFGPAGSAGYERPTLTMTCYLPIVKDLDTKLNYFGNPQTGVAPKYISTDIVPMNYYILFNMWLLNHRYYLKDISPYEIGSYNNLALPINSMINRTDWFGNEILSSKGLPVIISAITINRAIMDFEMKSDSDSDYIEVQLELVVDNGT